jgi:hypothetical protein
MWPPDPHSNSTYKRGDLIEKSKIVGVIMNGEFQIMEYLRLYPPGTQLGSWKRLPLENQALDAELMQFPGAGCTRRSTSDNDDGNMSHKQFG